MNTSIRKGPFKFIESQKIYQNPWITLREDKVIRPGDKEGIFGVIEMKSGSSVLALTNDNQVMLVKEYKYGIEQETIETISGALEVNETPLQAAKRELKEELGVEAKEWVSFGVVNPFTTVVKSPNYMFLAMGIKEMGEPNPDDGEVIEMVKIPFQTAFEMVIKSEITHSASCVLILKAFYHLKKEL